MENKEVYDQRDMLLGRIDERTARIPEIENKVEQANVDIKELHGRIIAVEVKSGLYGMIGAMVIFAGIKIKSLFGVS